MKRIIEFVGTVAVCLLFCGIDSIVNILLGVFGL